MKDKYPYRTPALRIDQPLGVFYVASLPASLLLDVAYSDTLKAMTSEDGIGYELAGNQRLLQEKRFPAIAEYINTNDSAFPNSIILSANFNEKDGQLLSEDANEQGEIQGELRWKVEDNKDGTYTLIIPSAEKLAAVVDGQHRLFAFAKADSKRLSMGLLCSVYLDLPKPFQAQLFARINSTQKRVDKSLTYELFGYNLEEEEEAYWSPDKLAVYFTRKLATDVTSALHQRVQIAPLKDVELENLSKGSGWKISTAAVVEGIMRLITSNPKRDDYQLRSENTKLKREELARLRADKSPLRAAYLACQDKIIYMMVFNYLAACKKVFWDNAPSGSFIVKTVGIQALFDVLRRIAADTYEGKDLRVSYFEGVLAPAAGLDFASAEFQDASGSGRSKIRNAIISATGI